MKADSTVLMSHHCVRIVVGAAWLLVLLPHWAIAAANDVVRISDVWVRATLPGQSVGAAYMRVRSKEDVTLIEVTSTVSRTAELHQMSMLGDLMRMREVKALKVSRDKETALEPGGTHVMLIDLKRPMKAGDALTLKLTFRRADGSTFVLPVSARVKSMAAEAMHGH